MIFRTRQFIKRLIRLNPVGTMKLARRTRTGQVSIHRGLRVKIHREANVEIRGHLRLGWPSPEFPAQQGHLVMRKNSTLRTQGTLRILPGCRINLHEGATLTLGRCYINSELSLDSFVSVTIGSGVAIGPRVKLRDSSDHSIDGEPIAMAPIVIEDDVWLGMDVTILQGVTVGHGSVVAAGSVVTSDVPPHSLVAGVPAEVKREGITWSP
jgi:acetyltransferase-like isoleucine patch superfamily enzyme